MRDTSVKHRAVLGPTRRRLLIVYRAQELRISSSFGGICAIAPDAAARVRVIWEAAEPSFATAEDPWSPEYDRSVFARAGAIRLAFAIRALLSK